MIIPARSSTSSGVRTVATMLSAKLWTWVSEFPMSPRQCNGRVGRQVSCGAAPHGSNDHEERRNHRSRSSGPDPRALEPARIFRPIDLRPDPPLTLRSRTLGTFVLQRAALALPGGEEGERPRVPAHDRRALAE